MSATFDVAVEQARARHGAAWVVMAQQARIAAIFHELCRIDSKCQRTGTEADRDLPPCPAGDTFIDRRNCRLAGRS